MRPPRLTTRRWMALVAMLALALGMVDWLDQRSRQFAERDRFHLELWLVHAGLAGNEPATIAAEHHRRLADKYHRAARQPWLPVTPDPPEPE